MNFKKILIVIISLLAYGVSWAGGIQDQHKRYLARVNAGGGGVTCYNTDRAVTQDATGSTITIDAQADGQSFYASGDGKYLARIEVLLFSSSNDRTWTMRWGPSSDLSTVYYGEVAVVVGPGGYPGGWIPFDFNDTDHPMSAATSYYFGIADLGDNGDSYARRNTGDPYANGTRVYATTDSYNMSTTSSGDDWTFRTYECDTDSGSETIIAGVDTQYSSGGAVLNPEALWSYNAPGVGVTALSTGAIAYGYAYISGLTSTGLGQNAKLIVSQVSDGAIVATSDQKDCYIPLGLFKFTFSSGSVTASTAYNLSIVSDKTITLQHNGDASSILYDASGSYAVPPDPVGSGTSAKGGMIGSIYIVKED